MNTKIENLQATQSKLERLGRQKRWDFFYVSMAEYYKALSFNMHQKMFAYMQCMFGSGVGSRVGHTSFSCSAWHQCKSSGIPLYEMGHYASRQVDNRENVQIEQIHVNLDVGVFPAGSLRSSCIMQHHIDLQYVYFVCK